MTFAPCSPLGWTSYQIHVRGCQLWTGMCHSSQHITTRLLQIMTGKGLLAQHFACAKLVQYILGLHKNM